jgi:hypothetical protein
VTATGEELMPLGPHKGKPMRALDIEYLERIISYESEWKNHRPMFLREIDRRLSEAMSKHTFAASGIEYDSRFDSSLTTGKWTPEVPAKIEPDIGLAKERIKQDFRDVRTRMPIDLLILAKIEAAKQDITLNQYIINTLRTACAS